MSGVWVPSRRAVMFFAIMIVALMAFAAAKIATVSGIADGEYPDFALVSDISRDTPRFAAPVSGQEALEVLQSAASDNRELGTWLLMTFGIGAVAFVLRCRRFEPTRHQFA